MDFAANKFVEIMRQKTLFKLRGHAPGAMRDSFSPANPELNEPYQHLIYTYARPGAYTVSFRVRNNGMEDTRTQQVEVQGSQGKSLTALPLLLE